MKEKLFILKDFIGQPTGIAEAIYNADGIKISGHYQAPRTLSKKFQGFDTVEELGQYQMCNCNKQPCKTNLLLKDVVNEYLESLYGKRVKRTVVVHAQPEITTALLFPCTCDKRKGEPGDICDNCGNAILTQDEKDQQ